MESVTLLERAKPVDDETRAITEDELRFLLDDELLPKAAKLGSTAIQIVKAQTVIVGSKNYKPLRNGILYNALAGLTGYGFTYIDPRISQDLARTDLRVKVRVLKCAGDVPGAFATLARGRLPALSR